LLTQVDGDYEPDLQVAINKKQQEIAGKLINTLGPNFSEEHNLNSKTIFMDMFERESKDYYNIICNEENITKFVDFATDDI